LPEKDCKAARAGEGKARLIANKREKRKSFIVKKKVPSGRKDQTTRKKKERSGEGETRDAFKARSNREKQGRCDKSGGKTASIMGPKMGFSRRQSDKKKNGFFQRRFPTKKGKTEG